MEDFKDIIEEIKIRNDISEIISGYIQLKSSGSNYKGLCPFHNEKTPSFHVNTAKQIYKCFGCGEGGDVISFIMKMENLDFMDSVKFLANRSGIEINDNIDEGTKKKLEKITQVGNGIPTASIQEIKDTQKDPEAKVTGVTLVNYKTIKITGKSAIGQHRIVCRMIRSLLLESTQFSDLIGMLLRDLKSGE